MDTRNPSTDLSRQLSAALRDFMRERDLRLDDVAAVLGRSRAYVAARTNGSRDLSLDIVAAVAQLAHLTPYSLMVEVTARMHAAGATAAGPTPAAGTDHSTSSAND
jgi:transcriptional regulator with XRE-family HTH domain